MADINKRIPNCADEGESGPRGHRGHRGYEGSTGPTGPAGSGLSIIAAALVNGEPPGDGFISNEGFSTYTRVGPGQYQLALAGTPPPNINCVVNVTLTGERVCLHDWRRNRVGDSPKPRFWSDRWKFQRDRDDQ